MLQFFSKALLYPELSEIIDRIVASLEVRSTATANSFINLCYTISSVFRDLLIPFKEAHNSFQVFSHFDISRIQKSKIISFLTVSW